MKRYFHYTTESRIKEIIDSGLIKLATKSIYHKNEKPVTWVSTNPQWENTATKIVFTITGESKHLTFEEQVKMLGCARIEVKNIGLNTWAKLIHKANMDKRAAKGFEETGKMKGANPNEWYGSLKPIRKEKWIKAEIYKNGKWELYQDFENKVTD